jgi:senataxin
MEKTTAKTEEEVAGRSLLDLVFSWSITDVLYRDLYKNQVCMNAFLSCLCTIHL